MDDYKTVNNTQSKHVPKSLGANVGSDEWLDKKSRQIKAKEFSNQIQVTNTNTMHTSNALALMPKNELSLRSQHSNELKSNKSYIGSSSGGKGKNINMDNQVVQYKKRFN